MKKRISLTDFIKENLDKIPIGISSEIDSVLDKASNFANYNKAYELSSPLFEKFDIKNECYDEIPFDSFFSFFYKHLLK